MPDEMLWESTSCRGPDTRSADVPWSPLSAATGVPPCSDKLLFLALADTKAYIESLAPSKPRTREELGEKNERTVPARSKNINACWNSYEGSSSSESVDPPRGDDPVGPPDEPTVSPHKNRNDNQDQAAKRLGRRHSLNPEQRRHAALMRDRRSCWHCVFQKYPVCVHSIES